MVKLIWRLSGDSIYILHITYVGEITFSQHSFVRISKLFSIL